MTARLKRSSSNRMAHPLGNGIPGPHNWSGTDEHTCTKEPLGGSPDLIGWSVALVRTPGGWVGRIDNHKTKQTRHLEVFPKLDEVYREVNAVRERVAARKKEALVAEISEQFSDFDLELLGMSDRKTLEDWIMKEYDGDLEAAVADLMGW